MPERNTSELSQNIVGGADSGPLLWQGLPSDQVRGRPAMSETCGPIQWRGLVRQEGDR